MYSEKKLFSKNFTMVAVGQIISLFGNAAIRFVLPLYLLNQTGSSTLYGTVTALAFIPAILLSPVGGIVADRVNKRNIMVFLDFFTAAVILMFSFLAGRGSLVLPIAVTLMLLYGIAGAYQPAVQASIPALVSQQNLMAANSVINTISSFSSLLGPVLGGILYSAWGLIPVLWLCTACFLFSAIMEIFIHIPFTGHTGGGRILEIIKADFGESIHFITRERPVIGKGVLIVCGLNLFLSSMIIVGLPYLVTEVLDLESALANRLCGFAQGALALGGLTGGICAGVFAERLPIRRSGTFLIIAALCVFPIGAALSLLSSGLAVYTVLTLCFFCLTVFSTIFNVQVLSFMQAETPMNLIGKVIALVLTFSMCAQPLGSALYGVLFDVFKGREAIVVLFAGLASLLLALRAKNIFKQLTTSSP